MSQPYFVCAEFNTEADGTPVPEDVNEEDVPRCFYGPFEDLNSAVNWMNNEWLDDFKDVRDIYEFQPENPDALGVVNTPESIHVG